MVETFFIVAPDIVSADQEGNYTYTISNGAAIITKYTGAGGAITIPSTLGGYQTVAIGDAAFYNIFSLTSVTIPNSVTTIGNSAFSGCSSLTFFTIGNSVTTIGNFSFYVCSSLTSLIIGSNITTIGSHAFFRCSSLTSLIIPAMLSVESKTKTTSSPWRVTC